MRNCDRLDWGELPLFTQHAAQIQTFFAVFFCWSLSPLLLSFPVLLQFSSPCVAVFGDTVRPKTQRSADPEQPGLCRARGAEEVIHQGRQAAGGVPQRWGWGHPAAVALKECAISCLSHPCPPRSVCRKRACPGWTKLRSEACPLEGPSPH